MDAALEKLQALHEKYANDPALGKMPSVAFGIGDSIMQQLKAKYGETYIEKRVELEEKLGLTDKNENVSIQKHSDNGVRKETK